MSSADLPMCTFLDRKVLWTSKDCVEFYSESHVSEKGGYFCFAFRNLLEGGKVVQFGTS